jgi:hypothetical protein
MSEVDPIDRIIFGLDEKGRVPRPKGPVDVCERAQACAVACGAESSFDGPALILEELAKCSKNTQALLRAAMGLGGPIEWLTLPHSWLEPNRLQSSLDMSLGVFAKKGTYAHRMIPGSSRQKNTSPRANLLESEFERCLRQDPALPLTYRATFHLTRKFNFKEALLEELAAKVPERFEWRGAYELQSQDDRAVLLLPVQDDYLEVSRTVPFDFFEALFRDLEETGRGVNGGYKFSGYVDLLSPAEDQKGGKRSQFDQLQLNSCTLETTGKLPSVWAVSQFFGISAAQVQATVCHFFASPQIRVGSVQGSSDFFVEGARR